MNPPRLRTREKIGYSVGDIAGNFIFMSMILYQTRFYTDTVGLSATVVGTMFLLVRGADAIFDPIIGALADRTNTRWGKFRPWVLWTAVPLGLAFWLAFRAPDYGATGKVVYAYLTYVMIMALYSANNTPYAALMGVITPDSNERTSLAQYRFVAAMIGQILIQALALPLVFKFGQGDSARGWSMTTACFGAFMVVCFLTAAFTTRERVRPPVQQRSSVREDLRNVFSCAPWLVMFCLTLLVFTSLVVRNSSLNYYFAYYLDQGRIREFLEMVGLGAVGTGEVTGWKMVLDALGLLVKPDNSNAASVGLSFVFVAGNFVQIIGIVASKPLADRFGKKAVFLGGMALATFATAVLFIVPPTSVNLLVGLSLLWPLGWGPTVPLLWVMIADAADYSEWKTSRRATGFMYAGIMFALKAGLGLGGALSGWLIAAYGYVPNVAQTPHALLGIRLSATLYAALPFAAGLVCLAFYPISKSLNFRIQRELEDRRQLAGTA